MSVPQRRQTRSSRRLRGTGAGSCSAKRLRHGRARAQTRSASSSFPRHVKQVWIGRAATRTSAPVSLPRRTFAKSFRGATRRQAGRADGSSDIKSGGAGERSVGCVESCPRHRRGVLSVREARSGSRDHHRRSPAPRATAPPSVARPQKIRARPRDAARRLHWGSRRTFMARSDLRGRSSKKPRSQAASGPHTQARTPSSSRSSAPTRRNWPAHLLHAGSRFHRHLIGASKDLRQRRRQRPRVLAAQLASSTSSAPPRAERARTRPAPTRAAAGDAQPRLLPRGQGRTHTFHRRGHDGRHSRAFVVDKLRQTT